MNTHSDKRESISIRRAVAADAHKIGAVFSAAIFEGWKQLGELARKPMFPPEEWGKVVGQDGLPTVVAALAKLPQKHASVPDTGP